MYGILLFFLISAFFLRVRYGVTQVLHPLPRTVYHRDTKHDIVMIISTRCDKVSDSCTWGHLCRESLDLSTVLQSYVSWNISRYEFGIISKRVEGKFSIAR